MSKFVMVFLSALLGLAVVSGNGLAQSGSAGLARLSPRIVAPPPVLTSEQRLAERITAHLAAHPEAQLHVETLPMSVVIAPGDPPREIDETLLEALRHVAEQDLIDAQPRNPGTIPLAPEAVARQVRREPVAALARRLRARWGADPHEFVVVEARLRFPAAVWAAAVRRRAVPSPRLAIEHSLVASVCLGGGSQLISRPEAFHRCQPPAIRILPPMPAVVDARTGAPVSIEAPPRPDAFGYGGLGADPRTP